MIDNQQTLKALGRAIHQFDNIQQYMEPQVFWCRKCKESLRLHSVVCEIHYHDYVNQGPDCCWICYVERVFIDQLQDSSL